MVPQIAVRISTLEERMTGRGLYYYRNRYYQPQMQRFLGEDPHPGFKRLPQSLNKYAYVMNQPSNFVDPLGLTRKDPNPAEPSPPWCPPLGFCFPPECPLGLENCPGGVRPQGGGPIPDTGGGGPSQQEPDPRPEIWPHGFCAEPTCVFQGQPYKYGDDIGTPKPKPENL